MFFRGSAVASKNLVASEDAFERLVSLAFREKTSVTRKRDRV